MQVRSYFLGNTSSVSYHYERNLWISHVHYHGGCAEHLFPPQLGSLPLWGALHLLCNCCLNSKNSTVTQLMYGFIVLLGCHVLYHAERMEAEVKKILGFCEGRFKIQVAILKADKIVMCWLVGTLYIGLTLP